MYLFSDYKHYCKLWCAVHCKTIITLWNNTVKNTVFWALCVVSWGFTGGFCCNGKDSTLENCYHVGKKKQLRLTFLNVEWRLSKMYFMDDDMWIWRPHAPTETKSSVLTFVCLCESHLECIIGKRCHVLWVFFIQAAHLVFLFFLLLLVFNVTCGLLLRGKTGRKGRETTDLAFVTSCIVLFTLDLNKQKKECISQVNHKCFI